MKNIGLLGCGAIGAQIAHAIDSGEIPAKLVSVYDQDTKRANALVASLSKHYHQIAAVLQYA